MENENNKEKKEKSISDKFLDKILNFFFSKDPRKWLILIMILGFILRFLATSNVTPQVADEMVHTVHAIGISDSGVINLQNQCPLWFYLTDLSYKLFGVNAFGARFLSLFFGLLTVPLLYIISKKLFNTKVALVSAFLLAISSFHIRYSLGEMDEAMIFFILLAFYFFIQGIEKKQQFTLSVFIFLAVAMLIKPITVIFIPAFAIYFFYMLFKEKNIQERNKIFRKNRKPLILGSIIFIISMAPILVYNYLVYREKGISDIIFSRFFNIAPELYAGLQGGSGGGFVISKFIQYLPGMLKSFWTLDPLLSIFGVCGLFLIFRIRKKFVKFFILLNLIPFIFLTGTQPLQTHFTPFLVPLCMSASLFIVTLSDKIKNIEPKKIIILILILTLMVNIYIMSPYLLSKSAIFNARSFAIDEIDESSIVIADSRIYRGRIAFMFHDKHYVESSVFSQIYEQTQQIQGGATVPIEVYFVECIFDDCGWGSIKDQPEFNASVEQMIDFFKANSQKIKTIKSGGADNANDISDSYFNIYKTTLELKPQIYSLIDSTHEWFYYPIMWEGDRYDSYELDTFGKNFLHNFGYLVLWIYIIIAILSPIILIKELFPEILKK